MPEDLLPDVPDDDTDEWDDAEAAIAAPDDDPGDNAVMLQAVSDLPEDPRLRAQERFSRLSATFAATLAIVAEMYRDRDWEHLVKEDGSAYSSLAEVLVDGLNVSVSMARRYVQGATGLALPLQEITVEGTRIQITSGAVAALGNDGMSDVVETATERLEGVTDPEESTRIIEETVNEVKKSRAGSGGDSVSGGDMGDGADWDGYNPPSRGYSYGDDDFEALPEDTLDDGSRGPVTGVDLVDPAVRVLEGAEDYSDPETLASLEEPLRSIAASLITLRDMDPSEMAALVTYDTRGVLGAVAGAMGQVSRFRALAETQPWFIGLMADDE